MATKLDTEIAIIGAGACGLLLAQGLKAAHIPFRIFERHPASHKSREWSMSLHWGGEFLNTVLPPHLRHRLEEINTDPGHRFASEEGFEQCNGLTGEVLMVMPGVMPRRVSRRKLRWLLGEGLEIEYNKTLLNFTTDNSNPTSPFVKATFTDTTTLTSRLIIGCDGSRSRARQILIANSSLSSPTPTPYTILNFPYTYPAHIAKELRAIHPVFKVAYHPKLPAMYMLSVLDTGSRATTGEVTFQNLLSWTGPPSAEELRAEPELALQQLRKLGAQFAAPFSTAAANVRDGTEVFVDRGMQWDPRPYFTSSPPQTPPDTGAGTPSSPTTTAWNHRTNFSGLVTLAGDAAHPMLPHRGQGLNHALEDAAKLVAALTAVFQDGAMGLGEAISGYEVEMVGRGGLEVEVTGKAAEAAHDWGLPMQSPAFKYGANKVR